MRLLLLLGSIVGVLACSCATPMTDQEFSEKSKAGLNIVVPIQAKTRFSYVGTTAFNNNEDPINEPSLDFGTYFAKRLSEKGYKTSIGPKKPDQLNVILKAIAPPNEEFIYGVGIHKRTMFGLTGPYLAHCNLTAEIKDSKSNKVISPNTNWLLANVHYFYESTSLEGKKKYWNQFTPEEKAKMTSVLKKQMKKSADQLIKDLKL